MFFDNANLPDYFWADLYWIKHEMDTSFASVRESISFYEALIVKKREELIRDIDSDEYLNSTEPEEFKVQYRDQTFSHVEDSTNNLKEIFYNSSFLTLFAILEGGMKRLCQCIENEIKSSVKHTDLRKDGDKDQFQKYFSLVFCMTQSNSIKYHNQIKPYRTIRNKIAHEKNKIGSKALSQIKSIPHLKIIDSNQIIIEPPILIDLAIIMEQYFIELFTEVDSRIKYLKEGNQ